MPRASTKIARRQSGQVWDSHHRVPLNAESLPALSSAATRGEIMPVMEESESYEEAMSVSSTGSIKDGSSSRGAGLGGLISSRWVRRAFSAGQRQKQSCP